MKEQMVGYPEGGGEAENLEPKEPTMGDLMRKLSEAEEGNDAMRKNGELSEKEKALSDQVESDIKNVVSLAGTAVKNFEELKNKRENN